MHIHFEGKDYQLHSLTETGRWRKFGSDLISLALDSIDMIDTEDDRNPDRVRAKAVATDALNAKITAGEFRLRGREQRTALMTTEGTQLMMARMLESDSLPYAKALELAGKMQDGLSGEEWDAAAKAIKEAAGFLSRAA